MLSWYVVVVYNFFYYYYSLYRNSRENDTTSVHDDGFPIINNTIIMKLSDDDRLRFNLYI